MILFIVITIFLELKKEGNDLICTNLTNETEERLEINKEHLQEGDSVLINCTIKKFKSKLTFTKRDQTITFINDSSQKSYYFDEFEGGGLALFAKSELGRDELGRPTRGAKFGELRTFRAGLEGTVRTRPASQVYELDPDTFELRMCVADAGRRAAKPSAVERAVRDFLADEVRERGLRAARHQPCGGVARRSQCLFLNEASGVERCEFVDNHCQDSLSVLLETLHTKRRAVTRVDAQLAVYHGYMDRARLGSANKDKWPKDFKQAYKTFSSELVPLGRTPDSFERLKREAWRVYYDYYYFLNMRVEREVLDRLGEYTLRARRLDKDKPPAAAAAAPATNKLEAAVREGLSGFRDRIRELRARGDAADEDYRRAVVAALRGTVFPYALMDRAGLKTFDELVVLAKAYFVEGEDEVVDEHGYRRKWKGNEDLDNPNLLLVETDADTVTSVVRHRVRPKVMKAIVEESWRDRGLAGGHKGEGFKGGLKGGFKRGFKGGSRGVQGGFKGGVQGGFKGGSRGLRISGGSKRCWREGQT